MGELLLLVLVIGLALWWGVRVARGDRRHVGGGSSVRNNGGGLPAWLPLVDREDVLVLDTETTGLGSSAEVIDLAVIDTTGAVRLDTLIMPNDNIPADASAVHGLTRRMLEKAGAPWWPDVHGRLADVLAGANVVLIYNAEFDTRVLHQTAARHGLKLPAFSTRCVMLEYAKYRNVPGRYGDAKWHKLLEAAAYEGVPTGGAHRALADAQMTLGLVRAVAR